MNRFTKLQGWERGEMLEEKHRIPSCCGGWAKAGVHALPKHTCQLSGHFPLSLVSVAYLVFVASDHSVV
jgi:hypothetical protein